MDHAMMGHAAASSAKATTGMPGMDDEMCSMNMIFTWNWKNLCVVFKWWHVRSFPSFIVTLFLIALLAIGYEFFKFRAKRWEWQLTKIKISSEERGEVQDFNRIIGRNTRLQKAVSYGILVGYSYMLMLVFMTYNGWAMLSVVVGAIIGNYLYGGEINETMACH